MDFLSPTGMLGLLSIDTAARRADGLNENGEHMFLMLHSPAYTILASEYTVWVCGHTTQVQNYVAAMQCTE